MAKVYSILAGDYLEDVISSSPPFIGRGGGGYLVELDAKPKKRGTITLYNEEEEILELLAIIMPVIHEQERNKT